MLKLLAFFALMCKILSLSLFVVYFSFQLITGGWEKKKAWESTNDYRFFDCFVMSWNCGDCVFYNWISAWWEGKNNNRKCANVKKKKSPFGRVRIGWANKIGKKRIGKRKKAFGISKKGRRIEPESIERFDRRLNNPCYYNLATMEKRNVS